MAVNRVGKDPGNHFNGHSMVIAPWGEKLISGQTEEGYSITQNWTYKRSTASERTIPIFQDRRTDLY